MNERISFKYGEEEPWDERMKAIENEKAIIEAIRSWDQENPLPIPIKISTSWGYRCFVFPESDNDNDKRKLLAWFVRMSGAKFKATTRDDGSYIFWNIDDNFERKITVQGKKMDALIVIEDMPIGKNCRFVTKEKTIKVKELVCDGE